MKKVHGNSLKSGKWNPSKETQFKSVEVATKRDQYGALMNRVHPGNHGDDNTRAVKLGGVVNFDITAKDFNKSYCNLKPFQDMPMSEIDKINRITGRALSRHNFVVRNGDQFLL